MKQDQKQAIAVMYLREAFLYSMRDEINGTGRMLRCLSACMQLAEVKTKISARRYEEISKKLKLLERRPSKTFAQNIYELCAIYELGPDEIEVFRKGVLVRLVSPSLLAFELRNCLDELTEIAGELSATLGVSSLVHKKLEAVGLSD